MSNESPAPIPQSLAFALHRATVLIDRAADLFLRSRHDISYSLFSVLLIVGSSDRITQREVADMLGVSRASITQRVAQLVSRGLIRTAPHQTDARAVNLSLTRQGGELLEGAWHDLDTSDDDIEAGVDVPALLAQLQILISNAEASICATRSRDAQ